MVLIIRQIFWNGVKKRSGFRPLTGIMVLIGAMNCVNTDSTGCFRPLTGIVVLIKLDANINPMLPIVSVPLRGLWFLSFYVRRRNIPFPTWVSVPLRGLWFLSYNLQYFTRTQEETFPSPYGDCGSYPHPL